MAKRARPEASARDWLSRAIARAGILPLSEAEEAIRAGRVTINRRTVHQPNAPISPLDDVRLDGGRVELRIAAQVLAFHKPAGAITSAVPQHGAPTVFELLQAALPIELRRFHWHAVGRLDVDTTGLLLFTNDEKLLAHVTAPESKLLKRYVAQVYGQVTEEKLAQLRRGVLLSGTRTLPAKVDARGRGTVVVQIVEGKHHQVKRMLGEVGLPVHALHREAVGGVELDLAVGQARPLTKAEIADGLSFSAPDL